MVKISACLPVLLSIWIVSASPASQAEDAETSSTASAGSSGTSAIEKHDEHAASLPGMLEPKYGTVDETSRALEREFNKPGRKVKLIGNIEEQNLAIEWNDWHNRFSRVVRTHMFSSIYETLNFPRGLLTVYSCAVSSDRHIKWVKILRSSGNIWYDSAVVKAIRKLDGDDILAFPQGSRRTEIVTEVGVRFGMGRSGNLNFGDVEYQEIAPAESPQNNSDREKTQEQEPEPLSKGKRHKNRSD